MNSNHGRTLAVLIDADNISAERADDIFQEVKEVGNAVLRRIYGDFSKPALKSWKDPLQKHAVVPHQQFAYTKGKNSSDIALVIDAMDLLHMGRFDGFVLVSSDSDFTRLANRVREQGIDVFGIGYETTPQAFRDACTKFIELNELSQESIVKEPEAMSVSKLGPSDVVGLIAKAMHSPSKGGWLSLSVIGSRLRKTRPDFDPITYGCAKLSDLMEETGRFEVDRQGVSGGRARARPPE